MSADFTPITEPTEVSLSDLKKIKDLEPEDARTQLKDFFDEGRMSAEVYQYIEFLIGSPTMLNKRIEELTFKTIEDLSHEHHTKINELLTAYKEDNMSHEDAISELKLLLNKESTRYLDQLPT